MRPSILAVSLSILALGATVAATDRAFAEHDDDETERVLRAFEVMSTRMTSPEAAIAVALEARPGTAVEIELDTQRSGDEQILAWEVGILADGKLHEVWIDALDGAFISQDIEEDDEEAEEFTEALASPGLSLAEVVKRARSIVAGAVVEVELDPEGEAGVWELGIVSSGRCGEIELSRASGLLLVDDDDEDDEDDEDDDDEDED